VKKIDLIHQITIWWILGMVHIIGITGASGSGKSAFCRSLIQQLTNSGRKITYLSTDWFYKNLTDSSPNYDTPLAFDFEVLINALRNGQKTMLPSYDYVNHCRIEGQHQFDPNVDFLIIEGIMLFNDEILRHLINTKIFVHTDLDACLARRILRDMRERGRTVQSVITQWFATVKPGYDEFIYPTMKYADFIFDNTKENIEYNILHDNQLSHLYQTLGLPPQSSH
jgi:uridine kinase